MINDKKADSKALVLLSGGLDSILAVRVLQEQGIETAGLSFKSHFFNTDKAREAATMLGIKLLEIDLSDEHLAMVKNPAHGYGKNMNPCIDCHGMMFRKAKELLYNPGHPLCQGTVFDFVASGEVLGQRPMSQNRESLGTVARIAGLEDSIVRPLSAKLLDETVPEKEGRVIRHKLMDISGRSRERQMELAENYKLADYPSSAGGCLLTDPEFSQRLLKLFEYRPDADSSDIEAIKNGRLVWLNGQSGQKTLIIIGRNKTENERLEIIAKKGDIVIELKEEKGPLTVVRNSKFQIPNSKKIIESDIPKELMISEIRLGEPKTDEKILNIAALLTGYHSPKARGKKNKLTVKIWQ